MKVKSAANWLKNEWCVALPTFAFVIISAIYGVTVPLWESPDELAHFDYIEHLVKTRSLPVQRIGVRDAAHHPPLYYLIAALFSSTADFDDPTGRLRRNPEFVWAGLDTKKHNIGLHRSSETFPYRGIALAAHLARCVSVACGATTVALTYVIARYIFPSHHKRGLALLASGLVAFNPQFLFISGSVNIDGMAAMTCALALWLLIRALDAPFSWQAWAMTGASCGLAILTKSSTFTIGLVAGLMLLICAIRYQSLHLLWSSGLALSAACLLISGWWFVRNYVLYGDPLGWQVFTTNWETVLRDDPLRWYDVHRFFTVQFQSFWGRFGWMTITMPAWVFRAIQAICILGVVGLGLWVWRRKLALTLSKKLNLVALIALSLLQEGFQFRSIFTFDGSWYQGRYLFPVIAPLSILLSTGLWHLTAKRVVQTGLGILIGVGMLSLAIAVPLCIIHPKYRTPTLPKWSAWTLPYRSDVIFGERISLLGYKVDESLEQFDTTFTFYWQAIKHPELNYSVFVHAVDESGKLVTQSDVGLGSDRDYPSSAWWKEDIVPSRHILTLSSDSKAEIDEIRVGVYFAPNGKRLPAVEQGAFIGDYITLDSSMVGCP